MQSQEKSATDFFVMAATKLFSTDRGSSFRPISTLPMVLRYRGKLPLYHAITAQKRSGGKAAIIINLQ
jgi:hypothetical protein